MIIFFFRDKNLKKKLGLFKKNKLNFHREKVDRFLSFTVKYHEILWIVSYQLLWNTVKYCTEYLWILIICCACIRGASDLSQ